MKRIFDFVLAGLLVVSFSWLFPLIWLVIRFTAKGSPLYVQPRVGTNQEIFSCYKFRTMREGTPQRGTHETPKDALTGVGAFLRKTKLDELPQLFNVLFGDMSLVGPRPCLPIQKEVVAARAAKNVFAVKPGITGLAQIKGIDMSEPEVIANIDAEYIESASLWGDFKILLLTFTGRGSGDNVNNISSSVISSDLPREAVETTSLKRSQK